MFFSTIVMRKIRSDLLKSCACISYYLALIPPCIYATISIIKKIAWNFSKNSSDLVAGPFPNDNNDDNVSYITISALKQIVKLYFIFMGPQLKNSLYKDGWSAANLDW